MNEETKAVALTIAAFTAFTVSVAAVGSADSAALSIFAFFNFIVAIFTSTEKEYYKISIKASILSLLLSGISFALSFGLNPDFSFLWTWQAAVLLIILTEIFFLLDKKQPSKRDNVEAFTWKRKGVGLWHALCSLVGLDILYNLALVVKDYWQEILKWTGYIGAGIIILIALYGLIRGYGWLNSLKYRRRT